MVRRQSTLDFGVFEKILMFPILCELKHCLPFTFLCELHSKARPIIPPIPVLIFCYLNLPNKSFLSTHFNSCCSSQPVSGLSPKPWGAVNGFRVATQTQIPMETKGLRKQKERNRQALRDLLCSLSKFFLLSGMKASAYLYTYWNERTWPLPSNPQIS